MVVTKNIPLSQSKVATVDAEDFDYLNQWKWYYSHYGYAVTTWAGRKIYMHRLLMDTPEGMDTDHINRDTVDNRKENLRICTHRQNQQNRAKPSHNTSGFKGVTWHKQHKKWWARIKVKGQTISLGTYASAEEAALAYDVAATKHFGEYSLTNGINI